MIRQLRQIVHNRYALALSLLVALLPSYTTAQTEGAAGMYVAVDEPMIVNILSHDSIHFLQVTTEFKLRDPKMAEVVELHMAPIKHSLMMLFSEKKFYEMQSVNYKRKLREEALILVQEVMKEKTGDTVIEEIFFTSLVVQ